MANDEYPEVVKIGEMDVPVSAELRERCDRIIEREGLNGDRELADRMIDELETGELNTADSDH